MGKKRNVCRVLAGKPERRRPLGRPRHRRVVNIQMGLRETNWKFGLDLSGSGWIPVPGYC